MGSSGGGPAPDRREQRFVEVFDRSYAAVRRYVHHRGLRGHDAADVVAEVFVVAWRRLDDVPEDDPVPWLFAVARNVWRNHRRADARRSRLLERLPVPPDVGPPEVGESPVPGEIGAALERLSEADREVLVLVAWDGLTAEQLGVALECTPGAARVRLHRARARFAAALAETFDPSVVTAATERTDLIDVSPIDRSGR